MLKDIVLTKAMLDVYTEIGKAGQKLGIEVIQLREYPDGYELVTTDTHRLLRYTSGDTAKRATVDTPCVVRYIDPKVMKNSCTKEGAGYRALYRLHLDRCCFDAGSVINFPNYHQVLPVCTGLPYGTLSKAYFNLYCPLNIDPAYIITAQKLVPDDGAVDIKVGSKLGGPIVIENGNLTHIIMPVRSKEGDDERKQWADVVASNKGKI